MLGLVIRLPIGITWYRFTSMTRIFFQFLNLIAVAGCFVILIFRSDDFLAS